MILRSVETSRCLGRLAVSTGLVGPIAPTGAAAPAGSVGPVAPVAPTGPAVSATAAVSSDGYSGSSPATGVETKAEIARLIRSFWTRSCRDVRLAGIVDYLLCKVEIGLRAGEGVPGIVEDGLAA